MKRNTINITILLVCIWLVACKNRHGENKVADVTVISFQPKTPAEMDSVIVDVFKGLNNRASNWGTLLREERYDRLMPSRLAILNYIDSSIVRLEHVKDLNGSERYRSQVFNTLRLQKNLLTRAYAPFDTVTNKTPKELLDSIRKNLLDLAGDENDMSQDVDNARAEYCRNNHLPCLP